MASQGGHTAGQAHHHHHHHAHGHHATHAQVLANHMNQHVLLSTEVTKYLKQNTKLPKAVPYCSDRVRQRTSTTCVPDTTEDWNKKFCRRQSYLSKGFFTPQQDPYESIGHVELDSRILVLKVFSDCLPKKVHAAAFFIGSHKLGFTPPKTDEKSEQASKSHVPKAGGSQLLGRQHSELDEEAVSSAGYTYIKDYLKESEQILVAERGGQTFEKCVMEMENARKQTDDSITQQSTLNFCPPAGLTRGGSLVCSSSLYSQARPSSVISTDSVRSDISARTSKTKPLDDELEEELIRLNILRNHKAVAEKLKAIHRLLNALHNIKSKDLRTRVPLSHEMVTFLYRHVPYERPAFSRLARPIGQQPAAPMEMIQSSDTVSSNEFNPTAALAVPAAAGAGMMNRCTSKSHLSNKSNASIRPGDHPPTPSTPVQWRKPGYRQTIPSLHHKSRPSDKEHRLETWDDLLAIPTTTASTSSGQQTHRLSVVNQGTGCNPNSGFSKWMASHLRHHQHEREHQHHHPPAARQPYWMTVAVSSADKSTKRQAQAKGSSSQTDAEDPERTLSTLKENFSKVQKKMAREALTDIERMERERCRTFRQKFHAANEHPVMEIAVRHMREAPRISRQLAVTEDCDMKEIKPSKWYIDLKKEAENVVGKDDAVINKILQRLARWSLEDAKSIPNPKEKLCLLVMSMPASELLTIEVQQAIHFVLEHILWASRNCFSQWLNHRKIPVIIPSTYSIH